LNVISASIPDLQSRGGRIIDRGTALSLKTLPMKTLWTAITSDGAAFVRK
jgi:hypothetical protein